MTNFHVSDEGNKTIITVCNAIMRSIAKQILGSHSGKDDTLACEIPVFLRNILSPSSGLVSAWS